MIQLSQKEQMLLNDQKSQEEVCVEKYRKYSDQAQNLQLKQLFSALSTEEQHHLDTINQLLAGQEPNMNQPQQPQQKPQPADFTQPGPGNPNDKMLCSDLLSTEKYVSGTYDTSIFEAANPAVRQALQHIQKDEQQHGEILFNYMHSHGMYNVQ
jgi:spore coat protein CotF